MKMSPFASQHYALPTTTKQPQNNKHRIRIVIIVVVSAFCPYAVLLVAVNFRICRDCCFQYAQWHSASFGMRVSGDYAGWFDNFNFSQN